MLRAVIAFFAVLAAIFLLSVLVGWLANRRNASPIHVIAVCNTFLFTSVVLAIDEFWRHGFTFYGVFFAMLMFWLAYSAARAGVVGVNRAKAKQQGAP